MKSFFVCVLLVALVGVGLCGRLRRQAPAGVPIPDGISPGSNVGASGKDAGINAVDTQENMGVALPADRIKTAIKEASDEDTDDSLDTADPANSADTADTADSSDSAAE